MDDLLNQCPVCQKPSYKSCSFCGNVYYCSKEHQKIDWKNHKTNCAPFRICSNEILGRYLVASRDIKESEVIMNKKPLMIGPKIASFPLCLGCHKILVSQNSDFFKCKKCKWPLCNELCQSSPNHLLECVIFTKTKYAPQIPNNGTKQGVYSIITPLRAILLKNTNFEKFNSLISMQSHLEQNLNTTLYKFLKTTLVPLITQIYNDTTPEEILKICSIFDTNSFEIRDDPGFIKIRGLYPMVSLLSHDCTTNTKHVFHGDEHQIKVIATISIKKGDLIKTTYTQTLWSTLMRRLHLKSTKNFDCICDRCIDPTEFGTFAGSINCPECDNGTSKLLSLNPILHESSWRCNRCTFEMSSELMREWNDNLRKQIQMIDKKEPKEFEDFLENSKTVLHSSNWHVLEIKYALIQLYGNTPGYLLKDLPNNLLNRKIDLCKEMLKIANILVPGNSRFNGLILHELEKTMVVKAKRDLNANTIDIIEFKEILKNALKILETSSIQLEHEPNIENILLRNKSEYIKLLADNI